MNKKLLVYPFDSHFCPILRHHEFFEGYELASLVSPKGWGLKDKDAAEADGGSEIGITVKSSFEDELSCCDTVLFTQSDSPFNFEKYIYPKICTAIEAGKDILCTIYIEEPVCSQITELCLQKGVDFRYIHSSKKSNRYDELVLSFNKLSILQTPVLFVMGVNENTNKFQIQLALRKQFQNMGYRVSQIGSRSYCELLGFESFPGFMFEGISEKEKIMKYNLLLKEIEQKEAPDLIIIGVPGGTMSIDTEMGNGFGVFAFEVAQAVVPDALVMASLFEDYKPEYFKKLSLAASIKYGAPIDCHSFSRTKIDWNSSKHQDYITYMKLNDTTYHDKMDTLKKQGVCVFNPLDTNDTYEMACRLVEQLSQDANINEEIG